MYKSDLNNEIDDHMQFESPVDAQAYLFIDGGDNDDFLYTRPNAKGIWKQDTGYTKEEIDRSLTWKLDRKRKDACYDSEVAHIVEKISDLETKAKSGLLETDGKNDILSQALRTKEHPGLVRGPNVWVTMDVVFNGSPSLPIPDDEEFLIKVSNVIGHRLLLPEELVLRAVEMVSKKIQKKKYTTPEKMAKKSEYIYNKVDSDMGIEDIDLVGLYMKAEG
ncbi:hypothetical protein Patl1_35363 [Pistacia atlantica]|nr:hypothetical protein Patl1_35363 [Pistacia atlantica]